MCRYVTRRSAHISWPGGHMNHTRTVLRLLAPLVLVAVLGAACGSSSKTSSKGDANVFHLYSDANIPVIGAFPIGLGDYTSADSFPLQAGGPVTLGGQAHALADAGAKKLTLIATQIPQAELSKTFANAGLKAL